MSNFTVVRDWITPSGYRAVITKGSLGVLNGYVRILPGHPLYSIRYSTPHPSLKPVLDTLLSSPVPQEPLSLSLMLGILSGQIEPRPDTVLTCHGGLTYSAHGGTYPVPDSPETWWYGFDCGHAGDLIPGVADTYKRATGRDYPILDGVYRDEPYVTRHCEDLARQLKEIEDAASATLTPDPPLLPSPGPQP